MDLYYRVAGEGDCAGQHLEQGYAQGIDIGSSVYGGVLLPLFRWQVSVSTGCGGSWSAGRGCDSPGDTEVRYLRVAVGCQEDVLGLYVPADDPQFVGMGQTTADLFGYGHSPPRFHSTGPDLPVEGVWNILRDYVGGVVLDFKSVDGNDVGMVQAGR